MKTITSQPWSISYQETDNHWMNNNMIHSIATILRVDIAVATHHADEKKVHRTLELYRAGPPWTPTNGAPTITEAPLPLTGGCPWTQEAPRTGNTTGGKPR